ncbi:MAG: hydrogenase maturation protease [Gaiellales bacterium]
MTAAVICVGNRMRGDDAVGLEVAGHLRGTLPPGVELVEHEGEPTSLIDAWDGADALWIVDAVSSGSQAGTVHRLDAGDRALPPDPFRASTHHVSLAEAVELARAIGRLPPRTVVYGIEGGSYAVGDPLTPAVAAAAVAVADAVRGEAAALEPAVRKR